MTDAKYVHALRELAAAGDVGARRLLLREEIAAKSRALYEQGPPDAQGRLPWERGYAGKRKA